MLRSVYERWLGVTALSYVVLHHLGLLPSASGGPDDTQWADWLDLLVPWLVLVPAAADARGGAAADPRTWVVFGVGAVAYASGHGIHLAANSVGNAEPGPTAHLWDEVVGHDLWYPGWPSWSPPSR